MKTFTCGCGRGATLFFDSVSCTVCGRLVGHCPDRLESASFDLDEATQCWRLLGDDTKLYRRCDNYATYQVCNWMIPDDDPNIYCVACRLNAVIPDLTPPQHRTYWARLEAAKRRTLFTVLALGLPVRGKADALEFGLHFRFMTDKLADSEFTTPLDGHPPVYTGHDSGEITINLAEADEIARTRARVMLGENYRTLIGHFRHEIGHYYWYLLVAPDQQRLEAFRERFGDERPDYMSALQNYYANGPASDWGGNFVSGYASMHPWEDWAECWAHYLHMIDTLQTAENFGLQLSGHTIPSAPLPQSTRGTQSADAANSDVVVLLEDWMRLAVGMNALNRSMGVPDAYPFVLTEGVREKLKFVHEVVMAGRVAAHQPGVEQSMPEQPMPGASMR